MRKPKPVNLRNAVVAITGAARGIGLAIAKALHAEGAIISIGDIDLELAQKEAAYMGGNAYPLDVRSHKSFDEFIRATERDVGPIDILINNAGIMPMGAFLNESPAITEAQIDINFRGVIYGMQLVLPGMLARRCGHIINVASMAGRFSIPGSAVYCGTKHAVVGLTEAVAGEHRDSGVNFSIIMPSKVLTELSSGTDEANPGIPSVTPAEVAAAVKSVIRSPRLHLAIPDYLQTAHAFYSLMPAKLQERGRRLIGDTGILTKLDNQARQSYDQRLSALTRNKKSS